MPSSERNVSRLDIHTMPLTLVSEKYGTEALEERLQRALGEIGLQEDSLIQASIELGLDLHKDDHRTYEQYNNHLLRVTLRLIELGVVDRIILAASPLHDSIEDHAEELARRFLDTIEVQGKKSPRAMRRLGYRGLQLFTASYEAPEVARVVWDVSNPILLPGEDKNQSYNGHVKDLMYEGLPPSPDLKSVDLLDNMDVPEGLEDPDKREYLDRKQSGIHTLVRHGLNRPDSLLSDEGREQALDLLMRQENAAIKRRLKRAA